MTGDIRTTEEVELDEAFRVRYAEGLNGGFEAVVIEARGARPFAGEVWERQPDAPRVQGGRKWSTIASAVEAWIDAQQEEDDDE